MAKLQDDVPAVPWPEMRTRVEAELGASVEELFKSFDEEPLAAASIGQVYRATLPDGTQVAVKVQRPGVTKATEIDLDIVGALIVGFAFLVGRQDLTQLERIGYRVLLFAAIASVIWFVIRWLRIEWHKRQADRRARH